MRNVLVALLAAVLATFGAQTLASDGTAVGVNPDAAAQLSGITRTLVVGADVSVGELITTGTEGLVQIVFTDETRLVVGPGSSLLIEQYLLRGEADASEVTINALAGSFRFITGNSSKDSYLMKTPTGTIGVRGSAYDLLVFDWGSLAMLLHGEIIACNLIGTCVDLVERCEIASIASAEAVLLPSGTSRTEVGQAFSFARFPSLLLSDFRVAGANGCITGDPASPGVPIMLTRNDNDFDHGESDLPRGRPHSHHHWWCFW